MASRTIPNPDALPGAEPPRAGLHLVNGTALHVEVRGSGPGLLLIHGGGEDAEVWRPVAERLTGFTVVTYDRRGTLRSGREDWPGRGSVQHADDAAGVLAALGLNDAVVFGSSSSGIVALQLALRHPGLVRRAFAFEPGLFRQIPGAATLVEPIHEAVRDHLAIHPGDWVGALGAFRRASAAAFETGDGSLAAPDGSGWYAAREDLDAEPFLRDDLPILTRELVDEALLASASVDIGLSYGSASLPVFRAIVEHLAAVRGTGAVAIEGVGHLVYRQPEAAAGYLREHAS